jgi:hypothetical protein
MRSVCNALQHFRIIIYIARYLVTPVTFNIVLPLYLPEYNLYCSQFHNLDRCIDLNTGDATFTRPAIVTPATLLFFRYKFEVRFPRLKAHYSNFPN